MCAVFAQSGPKTREFGQNPAQNRSLGGQFALELGVGKSSSQCHSTHTAGESRPAAQDNCMERRA